MLGLLEFLSLFDCVTPIVAFLEDLAEGGPFDRDNWTFFVHYDEAVKNRWSAVDIEEVLSQHGIKTWGGFVHFGQYFFKVKRDQAAWAEYVLTRYGIPLDKRSLGAPRAVDASNKPPAHRSQNAASGLHSFLDNLCEDWFSPPRWL